MQDIQRHQMTSHLMRAEQKQKESHQLISDTVDHLNREELKREETHKLLLEVTDHMKLEEEKIEEYRETLLEIRGDILNAQTRIINYVSDDLIILGKQIIRVRLFCFYAIVLALANLALIIAGVTLILKK